MTANLKVNYVRRQRPAGNHTCHWPGCDVPVPPAMWGCKPHWFALPLDLRMQLWRSYRPGQEITKDPSPAYIEAALEVQQWIQDYQRKHA
jgi:hypothetical protein